MFHKQAEAISRLWNLGTRPSYVLEKFWHCELIYALKKVTYPLVRKCQSNHDKCRNLIGILSLFHCEVKLFSGSSKNPPTQIVERIAKTRNKTNTNQDTI